MEIVAVNQISPDQVILWSLEFYHYQCDHSLYMAGHGDSCSRLLAGDTQSFHGHQCFSMAAFSGSGYLHYPRRNQGNDQKRSG